MKRVADIDDIIFFLFACWLIVDSINGYMLRNNMFSISQFYKSLVTLIVVIRCYNSRDVMMPLFLILVYLTFYSSFLGLIGEDISDSVIFLSKFLTSFLFFFYFLYIKKVDYSFYINNVMLVIKMNFIVFSFNILVGLFGWGYHSYGGEGGFGSHGFLYSINELSGVIGATFPWVFYYCKTKLSLSKYLMCAFCLFFLSFSMSTKSGIATTIVSFLLITYFYGNKREKMIVVLVTLFSLLGIAIYINSILQSDTAIMQRFVYFLEKDGLEVALTSGRLQYWQLEQKELYESGLFPLLFGLGGGRTVEMDPFDALLNCGILGLLFVIFLYAILLVAPFLRKYKTLRYNKVVFSSNLLLIIVSVGGGHILFSSTAGMLIAISNSLLFGSNIGLKQKYMLLSIFRNKIYSYNRK